MNANGKERYCFVINLQRCVGCHTCVVACKMENKLQTKSFVHIHEVSGKTVESGKIEKSIFKYWLPIFCLQCEDPKCVAACPTEAIGKEKNGIVHIDSTKCIGCLKCIPACSFKAIVPLDGGNGVGKCEMCFGKSKENKKPFCVVCCPTRALDVVIAEEDWQLLKNMKDAEKLLILGESEGRTENVFYIRPHKWGQRNPNLAD